MATHTNYIGAYELVLVKYQHNQKVYAFKVSPEAHAKLSPKDKVVVEDSNGLTIVKVVQVLTRNLDELEDSLEETERVKLMSDYMQYANKATAWVVCKVDFTEHLARQRSTTRQEFLLRELRDMKNSMAEVQALEILASNSKQAKLYLDEYKQLRGL